MELLFANSHFIPRQGVRNPRISPFLESLIAHNEVGNQDKRCVEEVCEYILVYHCTSHDFFSHDDTFDEITGVVSHESVQIYHCTSNQVEVQFRVDGVKFPRNLERENDLEPDCEEKPNVRILPWKSFIPNQHDEKRANEGYRSIFPHLHPVDRVLENEDAR